MTRVYMLRKADCFIRFILRLFKVVDSGVVSVLRYELNKHFLLITKFGETIYLDRNEIGSGNDLIYGNKKADVQMQLRIKF